MIFAGYNTNGFAHHRLDEAAEIVAELGYRGLALTPDVHHLDPLEAKPRDVKAFAKKLESLGLTCVIETGARFLLDPRRKHQPALVGLYPERRMEFLRRCVRLAKALNAGVVSFWSGSPDDDAPPEVQLERLVVGCKSLAKYAATQGVRLAFEPEPGMTIDTMPKFAALFARVDHRAFGLTLDVGHLVCQHELPVSQYLQAWNGVLWNIHIEDMRRGVHDHLPFGEGEVDFADVFAGLRAANYAGGVYVELSRHSYDAVNAARAAKRFLDGYLTPPAK